MEINHAQLAQELAEAYSSSKPKRIAAVYNDTPGHKKHLVAGWFKVANYLPRIYHGRFRGKYW